VKRIYILFLLAFLLAHFSCKKVPFFATEGATLIISSDKAYLKTNGDRAKISIVGFNAEGEAIHDHTQVILQATLGQINPVEVELMNGRATVDFFSGSQSGLAQITARSGNVEATPNPLEITIGSAALETLSISASPSAFNAGGGRSHVKAFAFDVSGNLLSDIPVILSTSAGTFDQGGGIYMTNGHGMVEDYLQTSQSATVTAASGDKMAEVEVTVEEELDNQLPTASFVYSPTSPVSGQQVRFNGSISSDPDGTISSYAWDFGDGGGGRGMTTTHTYNLGAGENSRTYVVVLRVTDNRGGQNSTTQTVTVVQFGLPTASFTYTQGAGFTINFTDTSSDPNGTIQSWYWDFDLENEGTSTSILQDPTHTYPAADQYDVRLTVWDNDGNSNSITIRITVS
jgi:PKD repeat protein